MSQPATSFVETAEDFRTSWEIAVDENEKRYASEQRARAGSSSVRRMVSGPTLTAELCPNCGARDWYQMFNVRCCFRCATASCGGSVEAANGHAHA